MHDPLALYLVHLWTHAGALRASVRRVGDDTSEWFDAAQPLGEYLLDAAAASAPDHPEPAATPTPDA